MLKEKDFNSIPLLSVNSWEQMLNSIQSLALATNVQSVIVPFSGHWIPEERPDFVIDQLSKFFGNNNVK
jgi:pimeloyl-ACP methyl ester carboxylesterase